MSEDDEQEFITEYLSWLRGGDDSPAHMEIYNFGYEGELPVPSIALTPDSDLKAVFSTTIGWGPSRLGSHWSRDSECCLRQQSYAIKNPNRGI